MKGGRMRATPPPPGGVPAPALVRDVGFWGTTLSGVGLILGAGIYVLIAAAVQHGGSAAWASFVVAAVVCGATGLSYAELASMHARAGASAYYAQAAFGPRWGLITGWLSVTVSVVGAAAVAIGFAGYASGLAGGPPAAFALALVALAAAIAIAGVRGTVAVAGLLTLVEAGGLVFVIVVGAPYVGSRSLLDAPAGAGGVLAGAAIVFFAFQGFEQMATFAEETRDPGRTLPRAILAALATATALYLLVAVAAVSVLDWRTLAGSDAPLADIVARAAGARWGDVIGVAALFATGNTVLMLLATGARMLYGMARSGLMPRWLGAVHPRRATPVAAILAVSAAAATFTLAGRIDFVAEVTNFGVFAIFAIVNGALIALRVAAPDAPRPFRVAGAVAGIPVAPVFGIATSVTLALTMQRSALLVGAAIVVAGFLLAVAVRPGGEPRGVGSDAAV